MISLAYLCKEAPSRMASDLIMAGYQVYEALAVSEVLYLLERRKIDAVVIAPEVDDKDLIEAQLRYTCLKMKSHATAKNVIWELQTLFGNKTSRLQ